jgi:predicted hydrocarbon binding protein
LEARFGRLAAAGVAYRLGGISFRNLARSLGGKAGLTGLPFRLLPLRIRLKQGLLALRGLFAEFGGRGIQLEEQGKKLFWRLQDCPICAHLEPPGAPACSPMTGMLKEAVTWISGGKAFEVEEITCRRAGDADCVFLIAPYDS